MKNIITLAILFSSVSIWAQKEYKVTSPDGKLNVTVQVSKNITYSLTHESTNILSASPVSMTLESGEVLGKSPKGIKARQSSVNRTVASPFYKKSQVTENYNELTLTFNGNYGLIFRAYNAGMAYRFTTNRKDSLTIINEEFTLNFTKDFQTVAPYATPEGSFEAQMNTSFEGPCTHESISGLNPKKLIYLPMLVVLDEGKKLCITEADLYGFPGAWLNGAGSQSLRVVHAGYPKKTEPRGSSYFVLERENYIAKTTGTRVFPWRLLIVAENDAGLINSDMVYSIAEPCRIVDPSWIKPGKAIWDWWHGTALTGVDFRSGMNTETFKYYVDFAAKYGLDYVLVDAGWTVDPDNILAGTKQGMDIAELVRYGNSKNVGILLWMSYRAFHHDMDNVSRHFAEMGVKGFKIDFQDRDDQQIEDYIYKAAETCAKYRLLIDFHGIHKPTGLQRTLPNVINYEGVMGLEWVKFGDLQTLDMVTNDVTIPFTRMVAGPFDYTPGAMLNATKQNFRVVNSEPMSQGTRCHQLAAYIVFNAPLAMISDRPSNYEKEQECINFMAKIPTVWEETVPLENKVSEYVSIARKKGNESYIGGMTNWTERELTLDLSFLGDGNYKAELFTDGVNANRIASDYKKAVISVPANRKLTVKMAQGGGFAARIYQSLAPTPPMGWNSYNCFGGNVTEKEMKQNADYMAKYLKPYGWEYVVLDFLWYCDDQSSAEKFQNRRPYQYIDQYGRLIPSPKLHPSSVNGMGLKPLGDYIHNKGLKFGIHIMRGIPRQAIEKNTPVLGSNLTAAQIANINDTCIWYGGLTGVNMSVEGAQSYYNSLLKLYAEWGVDYIKVDDIAYPYHADEIEAVAEAIKNCGKPIVLSLSPGPAPLGNIRHLRSHANLWRISADFWDNWKQLLQQLDLCRQWAPLVTEGHWPDADMLPLGRLKIRHETAGAKDHYTHFTKDEQYFMMTLWAIFRSPLMIGGNLPDNNEFTLSLLTNPDIIQVNQNSTNNKELSFENGVSIWTANDKTNPVTYIAFLNTTDQVQEFSYSTDKAGKNNPGQIKDLWKKQTISFQGNTFKISLPAHGASIYSIN